MEDLFEQDEMLREANVSPPILSELFGELRQRGVDAKTPVTVSQAAKNLMALIRDGNGERQGADDTPSLGQRPRILFVPCSPGGNFG